MIHKVNEGVNVFANEKFSNLPTLQQLFMVQKHIHRRGEVVS